MKIMKIMLSMLVGGMFVSACSSDITDSEIQQGNGSFVLSILTEDVETEDICNFIANIEDRNTGDNVIATFAITRCAIGNQNTIKYNIYGTDGMISFNLNNPNEIGVCIGEVDKKSDGLHTVKVPNGFCITQEKAFIDSLNGNICEYFPTLEDGIRCQKVLDAVSKSADRGTFVNVE